MKPWVDVPWASAVAPGLAVPGLSLHLLDEQGTKEAHPGLRAVGCL